MGSKWGSSHDDARARCWLPMQEAGELSWGWAVGTRKEPLRSASEQLVSRSPSHCSVWIKQGNFAENICLALQNSALQIAIPKIHSSLSHKSKPIWEFARLKYLFANMADTSKIQYVFLPSPYPDAMTHYPGQAYLRSPSALLVALNTRYNLLTWLCNRELLNKPRNELTYVRPPLLPVLDVLMFLPCLFLRHHPRDPIPDPNFPLRPPFHSPNHFVATIYTATLLCAHQ